MSNFDIRDGWLEPRSGISSFGTSLPALFSGATVYGLYVPNESHVYAFSDGTVAIRNAFTSTATWMPLTGPSPSNFGGNEVQDFYSIARITSSVGSSIIVFTTDLTIAPFYIDEGFLTGLPTSYTTLQAFYDAGHNGARLCCAFDDRLIFAYSQATGGVNFNKRVIWSARGDPFNYTAGGFEDLTDMKSGPITQLGVQENRLIIFGPADIWQATPRRDAFAFEFDALETSLGCPYPKTLQNTRIGLIWLGPNHQLYLLQGNTPVRLGAKIAPILRKIDDVGAMFATVEPETDSYVLFYHLGDSPKGADRALKLDLSTVRPTGSLEMDGIWTDHVFVGHAFYSAHPARDWAFIGTGTPGSDPYAGFKSVLLGSSSDTVYLWSSLHTRDEGSAFSCHWRSHILSAERDAWPFEAITDAYVDSEATASSTASLWATNDQGATFHAGNSFSITSGTKSNHVPMATPAGRNTQMELRIADGGRPRIGSMQLTLRGYTGRHSG